MKQRSRSQLVMEIEAIEQMIANSTPGDDEDAAWALQLLKQKLARKRSSLNYITEGQNCLVS